MDQYNNSNAAKQGQNKPAEREPVKRVVTGEATTRKKPLMKRISDVFLAGRADTVGEFIFWDIFVPGTKNIAADVATSFVNRMLFNGDNSRSQQILRGGIGSYGNAAQTAYHKVHSIGQPQPPAISQRARAMHNFREIVIPTRPEAEAVIDAMFNEIVQYNAVTVAGLYQMCGITPDYTDDRYGWTDIQGAGVLALSSGGYVLNLPAPIVLD